MLRLVLSAVALAGVPETVRPVFADPLAATASDRGQAAAADASPHRLAPAGRPSNGRRSGAVPGFVRQNPRPPDEHARREGRAAFAGWDNRGSTWQSRPVAAPGPVSRGIGGYARCRETEPPPATARPAMGSCSGLPRSRHVPFGGHSVLLHSFLHCFLGERCRGHIVGLAGTEQGQLVDDLDDGGNSEFGSP